LNDAKTKREENEIVLAVLSSCADGEADKLTIMSRAFLSDAEVTFYLSRLVGEGLIEYSMGVKRYKITADGSKLVAHFS
jgi:predicted transcriptional regulator